MNGPRHLNTLYDQNQLGQAYVENGKVAQGIALLEKTLADSRAIPGAESPDTLRVEVSLGWAYDAKGDLARAGKLWQHAYEGYGRLGSFQEGNAARAGELLGLNLTKQRKYAQAEPLLLSGYDGMRQRLSRMPAKERKWVRSSGEQIVDLYSRWPKPEQAARWRAKLEEP